MMHPSHESMNDRAGVARVSASRHEPNPIPHRGLGRIIDHHAAIEMADIDPAPKHEATQGVGHAEVQNNSAVGKVLHKLLTLWIGLAGNPEQAVAPILDLEGVLHEVLLSFGHLVVDVLKTPAIAGEHPHPNTSLNEPESGSPTNLGGCTDDEYRAFLQTIRVDDLHGLPRNHCRGESVTMNERDLELVAKALQNKRSALSQPFGLYERAKTDGSSTSFLGIENGTADSFHDFLVVTTDHELPGEVVDRPSLAADAAETESIDDAIS